MLITSKGNQTPLPLASNDMDRTAILEKIQQMLALQASTSFDGEAEAAAKMIEKLCKKHGISIDEAKGPIIKDEQFGESFKRMDQAKAMIYNAVAAYYGAKLYIDRSNASSEFKIIGSEAQSIQTELYSQYILQVMEKELETAYRAEKVIAHLQDKTVDRSFRSNFRKAFADKVGARLFDMRDKREQPHEDAQAVREALTKRRFGRSRSFRGAAGAGAVAGGSVGGSVGLNRQAAGARGGRALTAA